MKATARGDGSYDLEEQNRKWVKVAYVSPMGTVKFIDGSAVIRPISEEEWNANHSEVPKVS